MLRLQHCINTKRTNKVNKNTCLEIYKKKINKKTCLKINNKNKIKNTCLEINIFSFAFSLQ